MIYVFRKEIKKWHSVLWVVFASFLLGGLSSVVFYKSRHPQDIIVATVNGLPISLKKYNEELGKVQSQLAYFKQYARARNIPAELFLNLYGFSNPSQSALQACVNHALLDGVQASSSFVIDDEYLNDHLLSMLPSHLQNQNGTVNTRLYKNFLSQRRMSIADFEESVEHDEQRALAQSLVEGSHYVPNFELQQQLLQEKSLKKFSYIKLPLSTFISKAEKEGVAQDVLEQYYDQHAITYRIPEKRVASYWQVSAASIASNVSVDDDAIERHYNKHKHSMFRVPPKVQVRKILLSRTDDSDLGSDAYEKAQALREELALAPETFADKARVVSQDKKTARKGGFIDFFEKGTYDAAFEKAALRLKGEGQISPVVPTKDGFEIIQLVKRVPASTKPLSDVRSEIEKVLIEKKALRELAAQVKRVAKNDAGALAEFIKSVGVKEEKTKELTRKDAGSYTLEQMLAQKMYDPGVAVGTIGYLKHEDDYVLYKVDSIKENIQPKLSEVEKEVKKAYFKQVAQKEQKKRVAELKKEFFKGKAFNDIAQQAGVSVDTTRSLGIKDLDDEKDLKHVLRQAFVMNDTAQLHAAFDGDDAYLVQLVDSTLDDNDLSAELATARSESDESSKSTYLEGFIASLTRTAKIEKNENILRQSKELSI